LGTLLTEGRGRRQAEKKQAREQKDQQHLLKKDYKGAWLEIKDTKFPTQPDEMEQFFLAEINQAESFSAQGNHWLSCAEIRPIKAPCRSATLLQSAESLPK
jgi:MAS20 protein import receptor